MKFSRGFLEQCPPTLRHGTAPLCSTLSEIGELGGGTITPLLNRHRCPLERTTILALLRSKCQELAEFQHDLLIDMNCVHAAILIGARSGWLGLSRALRSSAELEASVSYRMAAFFCRYAKTDVDCGDMPAMQPTSAIESA